ncbi:MAG: hypothetical protein FWE09_02270 [Treponema sp.]|nr:hypothetical protein [Treponema sp.]
MAKKLGAIAFITAGPRDRPLGSLFWAACPFFPKIKARQPKTIERGEGPAQWFFLLEERQGSQFAEN